MSQIWDIYCKHCLWSIIGPCWCTKSCKTTFYVHLSRIWKLARFTRFIQKVFATKILLFGKFSLFVTLLVANGFWYWTWFLAWVAQNWSIAQFIAQYLVLTVKERPDILQGKLNRFLSISSPWFELFTEAFPRRNCPRTLRHCFASGVVAIENSWRASFELLFPTFHIYYLEPERR